MAISFHITLHCWEHLEIVTSDPGLPLDMDCRCSSATDQANMRDHNLSVLRFVTEMSHHNHKKCFIRTHKRENPNVDIDMNHVNPTPWAYLCPESCRETLVTAKCTTCYSSTGQGQLSTNVPNTFFTKKSVMTVGKSFFSGFIDNSAQQQQGLYVCSMLQDLSKSRLQNLQLDSSISLIHFGN